MKKHCERIVTTSKFEKNPKETCKWEMRDGKKNENNIPQPIEDYLDVFKDLLLDKYYFSLLQVLGKITKKEALSFEFNENEVKKKNAIPTMTNNSTNRTYGSKDYVNLSNTASESPISPSNPYINFFKRRSDKSAFWHEQPPLCHKEMSLNQIANDVTDNIATEFVDWLISIKGDEESTLTVKVLKEMFDIGSLTSTATTMQRVLKETPSVSQKIADARNIPEVSKRNLLHREILRDKKAARISKKVLAFGKSLPSHLQVIPPKGMTDKWMKCEKLSKDLETMATVWEGITHLKSTRGFCEFLYKEKPFLKRPKYLVDSGMMNPTKQLWSHMDKHI